MLNHLHEDYLHETDDGGQAMGDELRLTLVNHLSPPLTAVNCVQQLPEISLVCVTVFLAQNVPLDSCLALRFIATL